MSTALPGRRKKWLSKVIVALVALSAVWFFLPRKVDLTQFDPVRLGRLESVMWRHYYDKDYLALGGDLLLASWWEKGFSPWDSVRMAWHAAKAAQLTQPSQPRAQAFKVGIPHLVKYYQVIQSASQSDWNPEDLAPLELEWWVMRREKATWQEYGEAITRLTSQAYQVPEEKVRPSCLLRAELMHYRDERRQGKMTEKDWLYLDTELGRSWNLLHLVLMQ